MGISVYTDPHFLLSGRITNYEESPTHAYDGESESESDPYSSDEFRMYEFKIRRCIRSRSHDWTECPFAHPGERARRRDPRKHPYSASACPDYRRSGGISCPRGDGCGFAHGVFETWLHPSRYRTEACKDGRRCPRKVCFFSHSASQLRHRGQDGNFMITKPYCCTHSPRSTLSAAAAASPPASPASHVSYEAALLGSLVSSLRVDVCGDRVVQDPLILSPYTPTPRNINLRGSVDKYSFDVSRLSYKGSETGERVSSNWANGFADPDLGWVDDLLV